MSTIPDRPGTRATLLLLLLSLCLCLLLGLRHLITSPQAVTFSTPPAVQNPKHAHKAAPSNPAPLDLDFDGPPPSITLIEQRLPLEHTSHTDGSARTPASEPRKLPVHPGHNTTANNSLRVALVDLDRVFSLHYQADIKPADREQAFLTIRQACIKVALANDIGLLLDRSAMTDRQSPFIYSETGALDLTDQILKELALNHSLTQAN